LVYHQPNGYDALSVPKWHPKFQKKLKLCYLSQCWERIGEGAIQLTNAARFAIKEKIKKICNFAIQFGRDRTMGMNLFSYFEVLLFFGVREGFFIHLGYSFQIDNLLSVERQLLRPSIFT